MEGEFSEVKRRVNNKVNDEKLKRQPFTVRGAADGQDDSSTKENVLSKNTKPVININKQPSIPNQTVASKAQSQEIPKRFGKDFLEAPLPKINPWMKSKPGMSSDAENEVENENGVFYSKNTNAAEVIETEAPKHRASSEINYSPESEGVRTTDASPTKGRSFQRGDQAETRTVPAHNSHQAHNPAYKTSNKPKFWEKKTKEGKQHTDLNDSAQWPSLDILTEKNKAEQMAARTKLGQGSSHHKTEESNESDAESQAKPESPTGDATDNASDNVNTQMMAKKKNKQKWVQLDIELKTERRRGGGYSRGRGSSRPQQQQQYYDDQQQRRNRTTFRKPNKIRDGSRQGQSDDTRVVDENERNHYTQTIPSRGISFRGRRGQGRGRGGYTRSQRDSTSHVIEEPAQPFFAPMFVADEVVTPHILPEVQPEVPCVTKEDYVESKLKQQIEYYFSEKNLQKDAYLRQKMDDIGWVDMSVICDFPRVKVLCDNKEGIVMAMSKSTIVEISDDGQKLRSLVEPNKWPLKPGMEIEDLPKWKTLSIVSKLKADAPVFVPGQQYMPKRCVLPSLPPALNDESSLPLCSPERLETVGEKLERLIEQ